MKMFVGIYEMLIVVVFEFFIVLFAMGWDFASGYYKAKLRGEDRNSYGLRRTVSKFILYAGSICIASGIDSICFVCHFWDFVHFYVDSGCIYFGNRGTVHLGKSGCKTAPAGRKSSSNDR